MDPRKNPYAPGAETKPPALVGRDEQVNSFDILLERLENGCPYFLQEYGKFLWDEASDTPITLAEATEVRPLVEAKLDESFFRVRVDRTTDLELKYL